MTQTLREVEAMHQDQPTTDSAVPSDAYQFEAVPAGYKCARVGVIPQDWNAVLLGDLFVFKNGLNKAKQFFGKGTPIVNYMDVFERPGIRTNDLSGRVRLSPEEIKNFEVRSGDVFFTRTSETVDEIGVASVVLDEPCQTVFSGFVLRARSRDDQLDDQFKQYCFASRQVRSQIVSKATYTTRALTNGRSLSAVWIAVPPKSEQRAIAEVLSDVDLLLDSLSTLIAKKRDVKQATMQQLLTGRTRLPGNRDEWSAVQLGEIARIVSGGTPDTQNASYWNGGTPWCVPTDITKDSDKYLRRTARTITELGLSRSGASLLPAGSLLLCSRATIGEIKIALAPTCTNQGFKSLICNERVLNEFLYYLILTLRPRLIERASGSTFLEIGKSAIGSIDVRLPAFEEQRDIASVLSDMDLEIGELEQRRDKTLALKQGMMQQLLTGRTRIDEPEAAAQNATAS